jgi:hypothetical protein
MTVFLGPYRLRSRKATLMSQSTLLSDFYTAVNGQRDDHFFTVFSQNAKSLGCKIFRKSNRSCLSENSSDQFNLSERNKHGQKGARLFTLTPIEPRNSR